jgi:hypothetical protein
MLWNFSQSRFFGAFSLNLETTRTQPRDAASNDVLDVEHGSARQSGTTEQNRPATGQIPHGNHHPFESWIEGTWPFFALFITVFVMQNAMVRHNDTAQEMPGNSRSKLISLSQMADFGCL